jgi:hypothetical protein
LQQSSNNWLTHLSGQILCSPVVTKRALFHTKESGFSQLYLYLITYPLVYRKRAATTDQTYLSGQILRSPAITKRALFHTKEPTALANRNRGSPWAMPPLMLLMLLMLLCARTHKQKSEHVQHHAPLRKGTHAKEWTCATRFSNEKWRAKILHLTCSSVRRDILIY